jgi:hypothetical protein
MDPISWIIWYVFVPMAIATAVAYLTAPKQERAKPAGKDAFQLPTAEEGRPLPVLFGCRRIMSPNAISPLLYYHATRSGAQSRPNTFYYNISFHAGLCHANIDGVLQLWTAETCLWPTLNNPAVKAADGQTSANLNAANDCFGGPDRGGGIAGTVEIQYGAAGQVLNSYLASKLGPTQPAYRGFVGLIFENLYIGTSPTLQPWSMLAKRTKKLTDGAEMWYIAKAPVGSGGDLNAAHIIYEMLTSKIIGCGRDSALIGASFTTAANTCYAEGYGLSCVWDWAPDDIAKMIEQIEEIIEGKLYRDPSTGKFEIGMIRDDYNPIMLEQFDENDFWVESCSARSPGIVPSKVIVKWHDRTNLQSRPAQDDDIALLARQDGNTRIIEFDYSAFVCDGNLANMIAARRQAAFSAMPKRYTLRALRTMSHLHETSAIKISYPALNIASMIVRVLSIDRGSLVAGECIIEVVEDVYGQAYTAYGSPPAAGVAPAEEEIGIRYADLDDYSQIFFTTGQTVIGGEDGFPITGEDGSLITEG